MKSSSLPSAVYSPRMNRRPAGTRDRASYPIALALFFTFCVPGLLKCFWSSTLSPDRHCRAPLPRATAARATEDETRHAAVKRVPK